MTTASSADARRDELVERLFGSALGAMDLLCVYLGDRLGMYRALADAGPSTSAELASVAGVDERYAREWLEQQAMTGILEAVDPAASDAERRYAVPAGHDEVLLDGASLNHMAPMAQLVVACALPIHAVLEAFGTGDGVPYADYGGFSVLHCLPVGMVGENAAGTGTVMREHTVRGYAKQAGFAHCEVAPIDNDFWRFYLLTQ